MARATPRRRAQPRLGVPGWGNVLFDVLVLVLAVAAGWWVAEITDWQGSRSFRLLFFGVILLALLGGYAAMLVWNAVRTGDHRRVAPRHARHDRVGHDRRLRHVRSGARHSR